MNMPLVMILAGGRGNRMDILCHDRPKPNLPFGGYRVIDFTLSNCIHSGASQIAALVDYQRASVSKYLNQWSTRNAAERELFVLEPKSGPYKGTADAVGQHAAYLMKHPGEEVLLLAADHVYKMDYRKMVDYHRAVKTDVTVGVVPVPLEQAHRFGMVSVDRDGRILEFVEKPSVCSSRLASMGIYIFNKKVLLDRLEEDARDSSSVHDFGHVIMPSMVGRDRVHAYIFNDYWRDIGDVEAYYKANIELIYQPSPFSLNGEWPVLTSPMTLEPPNIMGEGRVINSTISPGCVIKGIVENSVLSPGVRIEQHARVTDSVIMANSFIGERSVIERSIIDEHVSIGKYCYVGFGNHAGSGAREITVVGNGVTVPNRTAIGHKCKVLPNVKAVDFVSSAVRPGEIVTNSLSI